MRLEKTQNSKSEKANVLLVLMLLTNILFPKAGIKLSGSIPLTVGNVIVGIMIIVWGYRMVSRGKTAFAFLSAIDIAILIEIIFWIIRFAVVVLNNPSNSKELIAPFVVLSIYPFIFWSVKSFISSIKQVMKLLQLIYVFLLLVMSYALIQYLFGIGETVIPGLTVNYIDYIMNPDDWWLNKNNWIGTSVDEGSKIVSTYQNGNILGASLIMLYPCVFRIPTKRRYLRILSFVLLIFTIFIAGSRSVMFGLLFYTIILAVSLIKNKRVKKMQFSIGIIVVIICVVVFLLLFRTIFEPMANRMIFDLSWNKIMSGAGRTEAALEYFSWLFGNENSNFIINCLFGGIGFSHEGGAYEMTYIFIFIAGGLVGLSLFLLPFILVIKKAKNFQSNHNWIRQGIIEGIISYGFTAFMDGAYLLPPIAINLWFIFAILESYSNLSSKGVNSINKIVINNPKEKRTMNVGMPKREYGE